jgi:hypothetical protein
MKKFYVEQHLRHIMRLIFQKKTLIRISQKFSQFLVGKLTGGMKFSRIIKLMKHLSKIIEFGVC